MSPPQISFGLNISHAEYMFNGEICKSCGEKNVVSVLCRSKSEKK